MVLADFFFVFFCCWLRFGVQESANNKSTYKFKGKLQDVEIVWVVHTYGVFLKKQNMKKWCFI